MQRACNGHATARTGSAILTKFTRLPRLEKPARLSTGMSACRRAESIRIQQSQAIGPTLPDKESPRHARCCTEYARRDRLISAGDLFPSPSQGGLVRTPFIHAPDQTVPQGDLVPQPSTAAMRERQPYPPSALEDAPRAVRQPDFSLSLTLRGIFDPVAARRGTVKTKGVSAMVSPQSSKCATSVCS